MADDEQLVSSRQLKERYGGVSDMWIWRRLADPTSGFPQPIRIAGRRYWRLGKLRAYEAEQAKLSEAA